MDIDKIVAGLNNNKGVAHITLSNLEGGGLTDLEKTFIKTYTPEKALIVYGTLAPDRPNHFVVEHISGVWHKGIVSGKLENKGWGAHLGYHGFVPVAFGEQDAIKAYILISDELINQWQMLDEFEGVGYKRVLAKYELENGGHSVGYIYAINDD